MKYFLTALITIHLCFDTLAQEIPAHHLEQITEKSDLEPEDDSYQQLLEKYIKTPLDLNHTGADELVELKVLTPLQVSGFLSYRKLFGQLTSIYELQAIPGWDVLTIKKLLPYVTVVVQARIRDEWKNWLVKGSHSAILRFSVIAERSKGFINSVYTGSGVRIFFRHRYQYKNFLQYGVVGEKDAGEAFFKGAQSKGFDFYSMHFFARKMGSISELAIGDYIVNMGQGLIHWQGLSFRYGIEGIKRQSAILRPYNSAGEYNFHRGVGITMIKQKVNATAFVSLRNLSANRVYDTSISRNVISSVSTSGYHRSSAEISDRNILRQFCYGVNICWRTDNHQIGVNAIQHHFSEPLLKKQEPYNLFTIKGKIWNNYSVDYGFTLRNMHVFGEWAMDKNLSYAFLNGLLVSVDPKIDISILYRNISRSYQSVNGSAHTQNSTPTNETGLFAAIFIKPRSHWRMEGIIDVFRFPWLKANVNGPSSGLALKVYLQHAPSKELQLSWSFRYERKQLNEKFPTTVISNLTPINKCNWQGQIVYKMSSSIILKSRFEFVTLIKSESFPENGFLGFFDLSYVPLMKPLSGNLRIQYFETDNYDTRIYAYESDVLFYHSIHAFFNRGIRYYININYDLHPRVTVWLKTARSVYPGNSSIGSGPDEIPGIHRTEIRLQMRINF